MGNHLHQATGYTEVVEDKEAQGDKAHVRHRRVSHQLLHVFLHHGHQTDVEHGHQGQRNHQPGPLTRSIGGNGHGETQETIRTQLQHDGSQYGRAASGRLDVYVRQPGVYWPHGHLDSKSSKERKEQQRLRARIQW